jgi:hypothetical protein
MYLRRERKILFALSVIFFFFGSSFHIFLFFCRFEKKLRDGGFVSKNEGTKQYSAFTSDSPRWTGRIHFNCNLLSRETEKMMCVHRNMRTPVTEVKALYCLVPSFLLTNPPSLNFFSKRQKKRNIWKLEPKKKKMTESANKIFLSRRKYIDIYFFFFFFL